VYLQKKKPKKEKKTYFCLPPPISTLIKLTTTRLNTAMSAQTTPTKRSRDDDNHGTKRMCGDNDQSVKECQQSCQQYSDGCDGVTDYFNRQLFDFLKFVELKHKLGTIQTRYFILRLADTSLPNLTDGTIFAACFPRIDIAFVCQTGVLDHDHEEPVGKHYSCDRKYQFTPSRTFERNPACVLRNEHASGYLAMLMCMSDTIWEHCFKHHVWIEIDSVVTIKINLDFVKDYFKRRLSPINVITPKKSNWYSQKMKLPTYFTHCGWVFQFLSMLIDGDVVKYIRQHIEISITCNIGQTSYSQGVNNGGDQVSIFWEKPDDLLNFNDGVVTVSKDCMIIEDHPLFTDEDTLLQFFQNQVMYSKPKQKDFFYDMDIQELPYKQLIINIELPGNDHDFDDESDD
jgi:hypothetical protein